MFVLRLIKKLILFPFIVLIQIARLVCKISIDLSSYVIGPLLFFVAGCDIFCLIKGRMQDVLILSMILVAILLLLVFAAIIEEALDSVRNTVRKIME